jgi:hypothetical protein
MTAASTEIDGSQTLGADDVRRSRGQTAIPTSILLHPFHSARRAGPLEDVGDFRHVAKEQSVCRRMRRDEPRCRLGRRTR